MFMFVSLVFTELLIGNFFEKLLFLFIYGGNKIRPHRTLENIVNINEISVNYI